MALLLVWHGLIILQVLQPSQGPSSSPLPISNNGTNTMVNQTIVPDKAILPAGDVYTTESSSDVKQAQESTNLPDQYTSSDSFRLINPSIAVIIGILGSLLSLTLILVLFYVKHCKSTSSTPMVSFYNHDHRRSILNNYDNIGMNINMIRNPHLSSSFHLDYLYNHPQSMSVTTRTDSGIDRNVVESLPLFSYSALKGFKDGLECAVCLSKYENPDILRLLPACKHAFHLECVDLWLLHHSTCPLCRHKVEQYNADSLYNGNIYMEDCSSMMMMMRNDNVEVNASDEVLMPSQWHSTRRTNSASRHLNSACQSVTSGISCRATSLERSNKVEFYVQDRDAISVNDGDDAQCDVEGEGTSNNLTLEDIPSTRSSWRKYITSDGPMVTSGANYARPNGALSSTKSSSSSSHSGSCKGINSMCDPTNSRRREASDGGNDQTMKYYALMRNIMMHDDHARSWRMGRYNAKGRDNHMVSSEPNCDEDHILEEMERKRFYHRININVVSGQCSTNDEIYHDRV